MSIDIFTVLYGLYQGICAIFQETGGDVIEAGALSRFHPSQFQSDKSTAYRHERVSPATTTKVYQREPTFEFLEGTVIYYGHMKISEFSFILGIVFQ